MIVGLTGYARSGKDTVARILREETEGAFDQVGFSDLLKLSAARALNVLSSPDDVGIRAVRGWADAFKTRHTIQIRDDESGEVIHEISGRAFLQRYGTEAHRELFGDDFWVEAVDLHRPGIDLLVVNDVRFPNEARQIRDAGGEVWRVKRAETKQGGHITERPLPDNLIDRSIENYGTLDDLRDKVRMAIGHNEVGRV